MFVLPSVVLPQLYEPIEQPLLEAATVAAAAIAYYYSGLEFGFEADFFLDRILFFFSLFHHPNLHPPFFFFFLLLLGLTLTA